MLAVDGSIHSEYAIHVADELPQRSASPSPAELLRAALEKIVFFEWRLGEIAAELAAAQTRAAHAETERLRAEEQGRNAQVQAQAARLSLAEIEADRARLAALLARPAHAAQADAAGPALEAERARAAQLQAELDDAREQISRQRSERERWLSEMIEQARSGGEAPAALAEFISELRGEVLALREREKLTDALMSERGFTLPPPARTLAPAPQPHRDDNAVEEARALWAQGRLGGTAGARDRARAATALGVAAPERPLEPARPAPPLPLQPPSSREGAAARALAEQCLRGLQSPDAARRAQAAGHLAAVPSKAAAPLVAHALGLETDSKARASLVRALVACGGEGAAELASGMLAGTEAPIVRLAAVEALASLGGERGRAALEAGARDPAAAVRRRTATLLLSLREGHDLLALLAADGDPTVRAASAPPVIDEVAPVASAPAPKPVVRDLAAEALQACRASIFGLSEPELADALRIDAGPAAELASRLIDLGRLSRRGKRLVARGEAEARGEERR